jgi:hypothetical protein
MHTSENEDMINHPKHYTFGRFEVIDVIEDAGLDYHLGNVIKYILRARHKGKYLEDLKKARFYLDRKIKLIEAAQDDLPLFDSNPPYK